MKKDRNRGGGNRSDRQGPVEHPETAYVYLIKNPSSNEISVCAWDSPLYPGTQVVAPTKYGLDLGMVLGSASEIGETYEPGCVQCRGACLHAQSTQEPSLEPDAQDSLDAIGELTPDGEVLVEQGGDSFVEPLDAAETPSDGGFDSPVPAGAEPEAIFAEDGDATDAADSGGDGRELSDSVGGADFRTEVEAVAVGSSAEESSKFADIHWDAEPDEDPCAGCGGCFKRIQPRLVEVDGDVDWIDRLATPDDLRRYQENLEKEGEALRLCREKVFRHGLDMKLVTAHYLLGEPKLLFFFTADVRVDFRELVKDLVSIFRIRIELRQIGVRDESRVLGGLAVCGRDFCCHSVTDKLNPVSIKMAKEQNLSLNSMKISGPCGRLLCCLSYEYDFYVEEKRKYPPEGSRLKIGHDLMKITEVNILSRKISLAGPDGRFLTIPCSAVFFNAEMNRWEITKAYLDEFFSN